MRRSVLGALVLCLGTVVVLALLGWPADRYRHNDFVGFWAGSRVVLEGGDPYDWPTWLAIHQRVGSEARSIVLPGTPFGYPLPTALLFLPFALLPIEVAAPAWLVAQVALALVALSALGGRLFGAQRGRDLPLLVAFAASSQPAWLLAEGGNLGGFLLAAVAGALALLLRGRPALGGALLGLLIVKPHPFLLFVPALLFVLDRREAIRASIAGTAVAGTLLVASLLVRPGWPAEWLEPVERLKDAPVRRANIYGLVPPDMPWIGWIAVGVIAITVFVWCRRRDLARRASVLLPLSLVAAPYAWSYDQLVLFASVAVAMAIAATAPAMRLGALVLLILVSVALPWGLYALAFRVGGESFSALGPVAVIGAVFVIDGAARGAAARQRMAL